MELKLYLFTHFSPDYTSGLAFAIAMDEVHARELIEKDLGYSPYDWGNLSIHALNEPIASAVSGGG